MALRRQQPQSPCACGCQELAARLAEAEALNAAIVRAVVTLRPIARHHSLVTGLVCWGVPEADARCLAAALAPRPVPDPATETEHK